MITLKQGDTNYVMRQSFDKNLTNCSVTFLMGTKSGTVLANKSAQIEDVGVGIVSVPFDTGETSKAGEFICEFKITLSDGKRESFPEDGYIDIKVLPSLDVSSIPDVITNPNEIILDGGTF